MKDRGAEAPPKRPKPLFCRRCSTLYSGTGIEIYNGELKFAAGVRRRVRRAFFVFAGGERKAGFRMEELKQRVSDYWTQRVAGFSTLRRKELEGEKHEQWMSEFRRYLPQGRPLRILDVGTGTGFFAFLLAAEGHCVTGIDLTPGMVEEARRVAEQLALPVDFNVMDAEKPSFAPGSFDVLVTRNLTWSLPHLCKAYIAWHDLLKKDGLLLNFDADYCQEQVPRTLPENHAHRDIGAELMQEYECLKAELRPLQRPRPQWDTLLLCQAGFHDIRVDTTVWKRIYDRQDEFYNPTPIFAISARA